MPIGDNLQPASFSGVPFFVRSESEAGGRKVVVHEYPGSDERFVQDLGALRPSFRVVAIIHGPTFIEQRLRLTAALARGEGTLVHPYLGRREVVPVDFQLRSEDRALGEIVYNIDFVENDPAAGLLANAGGIQEVFDAAENARTALDTAAQSRYSPIAIQNSIERVGSRIREGLSVAQSEISNVVNPVQNVFNEATRQIGLIQGDVLSIAKTPERLFSSMRGAFDSILGIANTPGDIAREWAALANFGSPVRFLPNGQRSRTLGSVRAPIQRTTAKRRIEDDNLRVFDQYFRCEALINSFEAEADRTFATETDLTFALNRLASDYDRIVRNQDDVVTTSLLGDEVVTDANVITASDIVSEAVAFRDGLAFDPTLIESLERLRVAAFDVLLAADKAPARVDEFNLGLVDIQIVSHQLYGNQNLLASLSSLNGDQNLAVMREPVKGLIG